jgi:hypothetical protein
MRDRGRLVEVDRFKKKGRRLVPTGFEKVFSLRIQGYYFFHGVFDNNIYHVRKSYLLDIF